MKLRVAVIGTGYLGTYHCEKISQIPQAQLVALCDPRRDKVQALARKYGCGAVDDYRLLGSSREACEQQVDAVVVAVPTSLHFPVAEFFLEKSIPVLLEKPMTPHLSEARRLCQRARLRSCVFQVGHVERFNPVFVSVKDQLKDPFFIEARRLCPFRPRNLDVDVVGDLMVHDLDLILSLVESPVKSVRATGVSLVTSRVDWAWAAIEFSSGLWVHLEASRVASNPQRSLNFFKKEKSFSLNFSSSEVSWREKVSEPGGAPFHLKQGSLPVPPGDALKAQDESFVHCVLNSTTPLVSGEEALKAMDLLDGIRQDIQERPKPI